MADYRLALLALAVLGQSPTMATAASEAKEEKAEKQPMFVVPQPPVPTQRKAAWSEVLDLRHWPASTFHRDLKKRIETLGAAHGPEKQSVMLDLVELYLTHMLVFEATSLLDGIAPESPPQEWRHAALTHATQLLEGIPVEDFETSPLVDPDRPDTAFWRTLQAIAVGDLEGLNANIEPSFRALQHQSRAMLEDMLPLFIEAAIETDHLDHADGAIQLIEEMPRYKDTPTRHFLRGSEEERRGNESSALDAYMIAAQGWDRYAARARLNIANMALRNGSEGALLAAQAVLDAGQEDWRGGQLELQLLRKQAEVSVLLGNAAESLLSLGKVITRFPMSGERTQAEEQASDLLERVYAHGESGRTSLSNWMSFHLRIVPIYSNLSGFAQYPERLGDKVLEMGATDLAMREFDRAKQIVLDSPEDEDTAATLFRLNLKLASAQHRAGLFPAARATLAEAGPAPDDEMKERHLRLKADVLADGGQNTAFLETKVSSPTLAQMRKRTRVLVDEEQWHEAKMDLDALWEQHPQKFDVKDATYLLIAAKKTNDDETIQDVVRAFPSLTSSENLIALAKSLSEEREAVLPLRADEAERRLKGLQTAFEKIKNAGISP